MEELNGLSGSLKPNIYFPDSSGRGNHLSERKAMQHDVKKPQQATKQCKSETMEFFYALCIIFIANIYLHLISSSLCSSRESLFRLSKDKNTQFYFLLFSYMQKPLKMPPEQTILKNIKMQVLIHPKCSM